MKSNQKKIINSHGGKRKGSGRKQGIVSKAKQSLAEMAKEHTDTAFKTLVEVAEDKDAPHSARVSAANAILDRAFGKPFQSVSHSNPDGTSLSPTRIEIIAAPLPDDEEN